MWLYFNVNEKAEILSWPGIWVFGFGGGRAERRAGMLSNGRGRCVTERQMNKVKHLQIALNSGGDRFTGSWQGTKWKVKLQSHGFQQTFAVDKKEPRFNPESLRSCCVCYSNYLLPNPKLFPAVGTAETGGAAGSAGPERLFGEFMALVFFTAFGSRRETLSVFIAALLDDRMRSLFALELMFTILRYSNRLFMIWLMCPSFIFAE